MGISSSQSDAVTQEPISATVAVHTTVYTSTADSRASEAKCFIDNAEIVYILLAFISGILSSVLVFAVVCLIRKKHKRTQENLQEQAPTQTACEASVENIELLSEPQNEVTYTSLVFRQNLTPMTV
ncbi:transmembrane protein C1orf162 homolog [Apteryx mantelli]|uniref:Transmembrane protein C1orf162 homolog n=1 Tax=Apteryx mantelli TaxID=2696672 RepID=A0ABM4FNT5_9AVES